MAYLGLRGWRGGSQGPHSQTLMTGGSDRGSHFIPKKITTSEFVYQKKSLVFLAYPKKSLSPFFATQKNPSVLFRDPKKSRRLSQTQKNHFWPKFQTQKNHSDPPSLKFHGYSVQTAALTTLILHFHYKWTSRNDICRDSTNSFD